jgi:hypothetical protein
MEPAGSERGWLWTDPGSPARPIATALAWLWRLEPVLDEERSNAVGIGSAEEAPALARLVRRGRLRAAVIFVGEGNTATGDVPSHVRVRGVARFPDARVSGTFTVFREGESLLRSSLGDHAVLARGLLFLGAEPSGWGRVSQFWALPLLARFLVQTLDRPLALLPPIGCVRLDDVPGTAQHQLEGRAHADAGMARRLERAAADYRRVGARLVVAVASSALLDGREVPLDEVWPRSVAALRCGVDAGVFELACHGTLHLDTDALAAGAVDPREFARLSADEAGRRLDRAMEWLRRCVGEPASFVAPAWAYSPGALAAARERGIPTWKPPQAGPLLDGCDLHETLADSLRGIVGLDYRFLARLAAVGVPPTVVLHGRLLDHRLATLSLGRDMLTLARLFLRRDLARIPRVRGVRWVGTAELVKALAAHAAVHLTGDRVPQEGQAPSRLLSRRGLVQLVGGRDYP